MKKVSNKFLVSILIVVMILTGCNNNQSSKSDTTSDKTADKTASMNYGDSQVEVNTEFTAGDLDVGYEDSTATHITLNDNNIEITGKGATSKEGLLTISAEGTYVISGTLSDGQVIVDAGDKDKVHIVLNGATVTCSENAPIYIKNADKVFITLKEGTVNTLTDGSQYIQAEDTNVDGVIFSKADLTLNGSGTLNITANYKNGIVSKDDLVITGGTYQITAAGDTINGKDCVKIKDGIFNLSAAAGNGIQSKNNYDATKGYVYIAGGDIIVTKCAEGIEGTVIIIADGTVNITAEDDGFNAASGNSSTANTVSVDKSTLADTVSSNDNIADAVTSGNNNNTSDSTSTSISNLSDVTSSATIPEESAGNNSSNVTDPNGTNTNGADTNGADSNGTDSFQPGTKGPGKNRPNADGSGENIPGQQGKGGFGGGAFENDTDCYISISGGTINIDASGDGIDSDGSLSISGGTTSVSGPTSNGDGGLDYNGTADITGGTITVAGSTGMAQAFSDTSSQYSLLYNLTNICEAGTEVKLTDKDGNVMVSYTPNKQYQSVVISSPKLTRDATYSLTCGMQTVDITLSSIVTSNGQQGMGGPGRHF